MISTTPQWKWSEVDRGGEISGNGGCGRSAGGRLRSSQKNIREHKNLGTRRGEGKPGGGGRLESRDSQRKNRISLYQDGSGRAQTEKEEGNNPALLQVKVVYSRY